MCLYILTRFLKAFNRYQDKVTIDLPSVACWRQEGLAVARDSCCWPGRQRDNWLTGWYQMMQCLALSVCTAPLKYTHWSPFNTFSFTAEQFDCTPNSELL